LPAAATPAQWAGQPGTRAPHVWLDRAGQRLSSLDLFGKQYVLITANVDWLALAGDLHLRAVSVGDDVVFPPSQPFGDMFGIPPAGAAMVRPDGIIGWRSLAAPDQAGIDALVATLMPQPAC